MEDGLFCDSAFLTREARACQSVFRKDVMLRPASFLRFRALRKPDVHVGGGQ